MSITYLDAIREAQARALADDPRVFIYGQDIGNFGGAFKATKGLAQRFPGRVIDAPISEDAMIGMAVGAAIEGMRPIIEVQFADFSTGAKVGQFFDKLIPADGDSSVLAFDSYRQDVFTGSDIYYELGYPIKDDRRLDDIYSVSRAPLGLGRPVLAALHACLGAPLSRLESRIALAG